MALARIEIRKKVVELIQAEVPDATVYNARRRPVTDLTKEQVISVYTDNETVKRKSSTGLQYDKDLDLVIECNVKNSTNRDVTEDVDTLCHKIESALTRVRPRDIFEDVSTFDLASTVIGGDTEADHVYVGARLNFNVTYIEEYTFEAIPNIEKVELESVDATSDSGNVISLKSETIII